MFYSIERIERDNAVLIDDNGNKTVVSISNLPKEIKEGNILKSVNGEFVLDSNEEKKRRKNISSLQKKLFK